MNNNNKNCFVRCFEQILLNLNIKIIFYSTHSFSYFFFLSFDPINIIIFFPSISLQQQNLYSYVNKMSSLLTRVQYMQIYNKIYRSQLIYVYFDTEMYFFLAYTFYYIYSITLYTFRGKHCTLEWCYVWIIYYMMGSVVFLFIFFLLHICCFLCVRGLLNSLYHLIYFCLFEKNNLWFALTPLNKVWIKFK